jgi:hypothetical protein
MEKATVIIKEVGDIAGKQVVVKLLTGISVLLPISQLERYGNKVHMPQWLYDKVINGKDQADKNES